MEEELKRAILLDHYQDPHNKGLSSDEGYLSIHNASDSCIDDITVQSKIVDGVIKDIRFDGVACTICTASTSMMSELLKGKTTEEAKKIMDNYFNMMEEKPYDEDMLEEDLNNIIELGSNVIRIGEFAWHMMESEEGKFDFSYFDHISQVDCIA